MRQKQHVRFVKQMEQQVRIYRHLLEWCDIETLDVYERY